MGSEKLFKEESIGKVILKTSIPSVIIILVMMIYNMADMFFIGQAGDAMQVAAVSLAGPLMSILSGLGTLVGAGGCAAIAIALGRNSKKEAKQMSSFCVWVSIAMGVAFAAAMLIFTNPILNAIGASDNTREFARSYMSIIALGAPFMIFSSSMANVVRAEGAVKQSMIGNMLGSVLNIILDPIFISGLGLGVAGAAIATVIGNVVATGYFIWYMHGKQSNLALSPKLLSFKKNISLKVLSLGLPTAIGIILMSVSNILRNNLAVGYGDSVVAAMGVAGRVSMIVSMVQMGICMGVQPAIAYNFGAKLRGRMNALVKRTAIVTVIVGAILTVGTFLARNFLVAAFIDDTQVIALGQRMVAITLVTGPIFGLSLLSTTFLQSIDSAGKATVVSLLRQGVILLPLSLIGNMLFGLTGLLWVQVVADVLATVIALIVFAQSHHKLSKQVDFSPPVRQKKSA